MLYTVERLGIITNVVMTNDTITNVMMTNDIITNVMMTNDIITNDQTSCNCCNVAAPWVGQPSASAQLCGSSLQSRLRTTSFSARLRQLWLLIPSKINFASCCTSRTMLQGQQSWLVNPKHHFKHWAITITTAVVKLSCRWGGSWPTIRRQEDWPDGSGPMALENTNHGLEF